MRVGISDGMSCVALLRVVRCNAFSEESLWVTSDFGFMLLYVVFTEDNVEYGKASSCIFRLCLRDEHGIKWYTYRSL